MGELEQILEEIREKSKDMVTFDRPHKYYEAVETTIAEKIIRRHLETAKELENKILEAVRGLIRSAEDIIELPVLGECDKNVRDIAQTKLLAYKECEHIIRRYLEGEPKRDHADNQITEYCPYCGEEITVWWDIEKDGYQIYYPNCGSIIMLCSMCDRSPCDWKEGRGCKHSDERYGQPNNSKWIHADKPPMTTDYVLLSFSNFSIPMVGRYERDEDGGGAYYIGDEEDTCTSQDLYVNGWQPLLGPNREVEQEWKDNFRRRFEKVK